MNFKAVLFDLDGTLLNTIEDLADSGNAVLAGMGAPVHPSDAYKYFVGNGLRNLIKRALPADMRDDSTVDRALSDLKEEYNRRWWVKTRPYEGIPGLLDELTARGIKMSILSNKADEFTRLIAERFLSKWSFEHILGERPQVPRKPDPAAALDIAAHMGFEPHEFIYLGDSGTDMETAKNAGMFGVGVLWGFRKESELIENGAKVVISEPSQVFKLL